MDDHAKDAAQRHRRDDRQRPASMDWSRRRLLGHWSRRDLDHRLSQRNDCANSDRGDSAPLGRYVSADTRPWTSLARFSSKYVELANQGGRRTGGRPSWASPGVDSCRLLRDPVVRLSWLLSHWT